MTEINPVMTEEMSDNGHLIVAKEGIFHSEADPEDILIQEDHTEDMTSTGIKWKDTTNV